MQFKYIQEVIRLYKKIMKNNEKLHEQIENVNK